mmetsp:Transcript_12760/g.24221  ORF Transcript_12760/g.24221 Transcript_12760/m.24221 type:complete len:239 (+) Transcript_12760:2029-2745(+)
MLRDSHGVHTQRNKSCDTLVLRCGGLMASSNHSSASNTEEELECRRLLDAPSECSAGEGCARMRAGSMVRERIFAASVVEGSWHTLWYRRRRGLGLSGVAVGRNCSFLLGARFLVANVFLPRLLPLLETHPNMSSFCCSLMCSLMYCKIFSSFTSSSGPATVLDERRVLSIFNFNKRLSCRMRTRSMRSSSHSKTCMVYAEIGCNISEVNPCSAGASNFRCWISFAGSTDCTSRRFST